MKKKKQKTRRSYSKTINLTRKRWRRQTRIQTLGRRQGPQGTDHTESLLTQITQPLPLRIRKLLRWGFDGIREGFIDLGVVEERVSAGHLLEG